MKVAVIAVLLAVVSWLPASVGVQDISTQTNSPPAAEIPRYAEFNKAETFVWGKWDTIRKAAKALLTQDTGSAVLSGEAIGCFEPGDEIKVTDPHLLHLLKDGLENAECPNPPIVPPGAIYRSGIEFFAKNGKKPFERRAARFPFLAWWPALSYGPRFWNTLKTFSQWYAAETRKSLLAVKPQTIDTIDLDYSNGGFTELSTPAEVKRFLRAAKTIDGTAYDVTEKTRIPIRLTLWTKPAKKQTKSVPHTFFLLIPSEKTAKRSSFSQSVFSYFRDSLKGCPQAQK